MRNMKTVTTIVIHCTDTRASWRSEQTTAQRVAEVRRWHVEENGWKAIGYAWLVDRDGTEMIGRDIDGDGDPWEEIGAGVKGHNRNAIHLCMFGGASSSANDKFSDHFTAAQGFILRGKISQLKKQFPSIKYVIGHNDLANKACPGFQVKPWYNKTEPRGIGKSKTIGGAVVGGIATVGGGVTAVGGLEGNAQMMVIGFAGLALLSLMFIGRERIKSWAAGQR